jgi:hypothetical protein
MAAESSHPRQHAGGPPDRVAAIITTVHYYPVGLVLTITVLALTAVIIVLSWYMWIVDRSFEPGRAFLDILKAQYRQHRGVVRVQALCLVAAAIAAVLVPSLAPR